MPPADDRRNVDAHVSHVRRRQTMKALEGDQVGWANTQFVNTFRHIRCFICFLFGGREDNKWCRDVKCELSILTPRSIADVPPPPVRSRIVKLASLAIASVV